MLNTRFPTMLLLFLFAFFIGQVQASLVPKPCSENEELTLSTSANSHGETTDSEEQHQDECCSFDCCLANCPCSDSVCSAAIYLVNSHHITDKLLSSLVIKDQLAKPPNSIINFLYRPPIYTS